MLDVPLVFGTQQVVGPYSSYLSPNYNLDYDPEVISRMQRYFYFKILDKWIYSSMSDILNYVTIKNGSPALLSSLNDYKMSNSDNDSKDVTEKKIKFIEDHVISDYDIKIILRDYVKKYSVHWAYLVRDEHHVRDFILKKILRLIKEKIEKK